MKHRVEQAVQKSGQTGVYQRLPDRHNNVLMYHSVGGNGHANISTELFRNQLDWLQETYEIVDLPEVLTRDDRKKVAITFDDGYESFYDSVLPILREYSVPATLFVISKPLFDDSFTHDGAPIHERNYLTSDQLREIASEPYVTIGNHSMSHKNLSRQHPRSTLEEEIVESKRVLEAECRVPIDRYCYPGNNWSPEAREIVAAHHEYAVRGVGGRKFVTPDVDQYLIPRIDAAVPLSTLRFEVSDTAKRLRNFATGVLS